MNDECMGEMEPEWSSWLWNECTLIWIAICGELEMVCCKDKLNYSIRSLHDPLSNDHSCGGNLRVCLQ